MNNYSPLIIIFLFLLVVYLLYLVIRRKIPQKYPYYRNPYFISYAERSFYKVLEQVIDNNYYIFPQVSLGSLLKVNKKDQREYWLFMNKINRKSVDFVIADKKDFSPVLVIELDDRSHSLYNREDRDAFLKAALEDANINFIRFPVKSSYSLVEIKTLLAQYLFHDSN